MAINTTDPLAELREAQLKLMRLSAFLDQRIIDIELVLVSNHDPEYTKMFVAAQRDYYDSYKNVVGAGLDKSVQIAWDNLLTKL